MSLIKNENCSRFALVFANAYLSVFPCFAQQNVNVSGYTELARANNSNLLNELRVEYAVEYSSDYYSTSICGEVFVDNSVNETIPDWCELFIRVENEFVAVTLGRQTLNWGLGQYFYVNDPFAKDWQSVAIGREKGDIDDVYDGAQFSLFNFLDTGIQFDLVWTKFFAPNSYADTKRINLNEQQKEQLATDAVNKSEHMIRLSQQLDGLAWAFFYHQGFEKQAQLSWGEYKYNQLKHFGLSVSKHTHAGEISFEYGRDIVAQTHVQNKYLLVFLPSFFVSPSKHFMRLQWMKDKASNWLGLSYEYNLDHTQTIAITNLFSTEKMSAMLLAHYNLTFNKEWVWEFGVNLFRGSNAGAQWDYYSDSSNVYTRLRYQL